MKSLLLCFIVLATWSASPALAHRLDEFLQATTIDLTKDHATLTLRLTPGVAVSETVLAAIDTDGNGEISDIEQHAYAERVRNDLPLTADGRPLQLQLKSMTFPPMQEMKEGLGEIEMEFGVDLPTGASNHKLILENHHQNRISVYLVNCLLPRDSRIRVTAQNRNYDQTIYQLDYTQSLLASDASSTAAQGNASLFRAYFYQGIHHILTGYDHLLFVSALVLAATTLWDVVKVVFTFTLAHSITLTLAALNVIHLPSYIVEPMISASIVFVALQNVFWPSRARGSTRLAAAFFFGLFHGLGFAGGLLEVMREMPASTMLLALLAFSIGVEIGHQLVVVPLFTLLKSARNTQSDVVSRVKFSMAIQRAGSAAISVAGVYYLGSQLMRLSSP